MRIRPGTVAGLVALACLLALPARAQIGSDRYSAIVLDNRTGEVLLAASPDEQRHPASLTKMMTLYMLFEAMRDGQLTLASAVPISFEAASRPPSKLGVPAGLSITVEQAILALVTRSANDVASAVGERLAGSEDRFGQMMTLRARALGMTRTTFRNASGLPDYEQVTTARDMATLGRRLIQDFPQHYHYFGVTHAQFGRISIRNHNRMLDAYEGVDGIKTGYIRDSGFNIVTSALRGGQRVVGAVFGGRSWVERDEHMAELLDQGFARLGVAPRTIEMAAARGLLMRQAEAAALPRAPRAAVPERQPMRVVEGPARVLRRGQPAVPTVRLAVQPTGRAGTRSQAAGTVATRSSAAAVPMPVPPAPRVAKGPPTARVVAVPVGPRAPERVRTAAR